MALRRPVDLAYHRGPHETFCLCSDFDLDLDLSYTEWFFLRQLPDGFHRGWMDDAFRDVP